MRIALNKKTSQSHLALPVTI